MTDALTCRDGFSPCRCRRNGAVNVSGWRSSGWQMKTLFRSFAAAAALTAYSVGSNAKVFDIQHLPKNINQLQNGDSFSVEYRNDHTRVIDREFVDVDAAVVTVEMAGSEPIVHHITLFSIGAREVQDRFGQRGMALFVRAADWGRIGTVGVGLIFGADDRWRSHHEDDTWWTCGN